MISVSQWEACIEDSRQWMSSNMLKLNDDKTEFVIFGTRQQLAKMNTIHICIGDTLVALVDCIQNLGFFMDKFLKNANHVNKLVSQLFYTQAGIGRTHDKLDLESAKTIVQALVLSMFDYFNFLLAGSAQYQLDKLQCIENMVCRVVCQLKNFDLVRNSMESLHWLKVWGCIVFKLVT